MKQEEETKEKKIACEKERLSQRGSERKENVIHFIYDIMMNILKISTHWSTATKLMQCWCVNCTFSKCTLVLQAVFLWAPLEIGVVKGGSCSVSHKMCPSWNQSNYLVSCTTCFATLRLL